MTDRKENFLKYNSYFYLFFAWGIWRQISIIYLEKDELSELFEMTNVKMQNVLGKISQK